MEIIPVFPCLMPVGRTVLILTIFAACLLLLPQNAATLRADTADLSSVEKKLSASTELEQRLLDAGLVSVDKLDPSIMVDLKYARSDNFMGADIYRSLSRAYLVPDAAKKLMAASRILQERYPHLRILVADAVRPRSVQQEMWNLVADTPQQPYVANPRSGSMHNYGAAVDVTLFNVITGERVDMGTPIDHFGLLAQPLLEEAFLRKGKLSSSQIKNRLILRNAMVDAGWHTINIEWWHFNAFSKEFIRSNYSIIE